MANTRFVEADDTVQRARALRRDGSPAEHSLWTILRGSKLDGFKFRRQQRFGPFCADLICHAAKLVIEIDGDSHAGRDDYDQRRTAFINAEGYRVLRFSNADVCGNLAGVYETIGAALRDSPSPSPSAAPSGPLPLPQGERRS